MALLPILEFPDPRLRTKAALIDAAEVTTPAFQELLDNMFETMYDAPGIGLAASQVDVHQRFMVIDVSEEKNEPRVFINPEIVAKDGGQVYQEGCLSVPGIFADVTRADTITVKFLDRQGQPQELSTDGLLAVCVQHEFGLFGGPAEGWRAYSLGDYAEWKVVEAKAGRVVLAVRQDTAVPNGDILKVERTVQIDFPPSGETPPDAVSVSTSQ